MSDLPEKPQSGLEPIPGYLHRCDALDHNPPKNINIPFGMQYVHVCREGGTVLVTRTAQVTFAYRLGEGE